MIVRLLTLLFLLLASPLAAEPAPPAPAPEGPVPKLEMPQLSPPSLVPKAPRILPDGSKLPGGFPFLSATRRIKTRPVLAAPSGLEVRSPDYSDGLTLELAWTLSPDDAEGATGYVVLRATHPEGPWSAVVNQLPPGTASYTDKVSTDPRSDPPASEYYYRVGVLSAASPAPNLEAKTPEQIADAQARYVAELFSEKTPMTDSAQGVPVASLFNTSSGHLVLLLLIASVGIMMTLFAKRAREGGEEMYIRRIPGIDAIEEGIGRATEMGKPVLYVPGIDELQDIQTIASVLILGQVARKIADYQSDLIVSCCIPIVREVADEVVKAGFFQAGHPDAYNPSAVRFIASDQFAFCAGTNGIMLREQPATNIYLGRFFAESLILAETGYVNRSIQIAGTAEATQLPFFIAACDYTLIGEELFAVSAYLSRDPRLVSSLKASDYIKVVCVIALILGSILASMGNTVLIDLFTISS